jgi:hypothetical protein
MTQIILVQHGTKLDSDNDILNILCFQFRCHASDPPRSTPSPYTSEDVTGSALSLPKPHSSVKLFAGTIYDAKAVQP